MVAVLKLESFDNIIQSSVIEPIPKLNLAQLHYTSVLDIYEQKVEYKNAERVHHDIISVYVRPAERDIKNYLIGIKKHTAHPFLDLMVDDLEKVVLKALKDLTPINQSVSISNFPIEIFRIYSHVYPINLRQKVLNALSPFN